MYQRLKALDTRRYHPSITVLYQGLAALVLGKYIGLSALSYRLVPRAGSPGCPGLAALGPEKYTGRTALGTKMYPGQATPGTRGRDIFVCKNMTDNVSRVLKNDV